MAARRVLVTGVANFWGSALAARLERDPDVEHVAGVDLRRPEAALPRTRFIEADLRSPELPDSLADLDVDTVVHNDINQFPEPGRSARQLHDINVIGTLQLLAVCERLPGLRALVVRGSAAIYGSEPAGPAFFTEDLARRYPLRTRFQRDLGELEGLIDTFARRHPEVTCTVLRYQPVLGATLDNPITRLLRQPVVPTFLGFDPRMQFIHEEDSVEVLVAAARRPVRGAVNAAADGTVSLTHVLRRLRKMAVPIPHPLFGTVVGAAARAAGVEVSEDTARYLRFGRAVDTRRMHEDLGFHPALTTPQIIDRVAGELRGGVAA